MLLLSPDIVNRKPIRLSPWTPIAGAEHCTMRFVEGTDPNIIANRVAVIEKTPRIRVSPFDGDTTYDFRNWKQGPKGRGCSHDEDFAKAKAYGFYPPSRDWCDCELIALGYELPRKRCVGFACTNFAHPEPTGAEFGYCESCQARDEV